MQFKFFKDYKFWSLKNLLVRIYPKFANCTRNHVITYTYPARAEVPDPNLDTINKFYQISNEYRKADTCTVDVNLFSNIFNFASLCFKSFVLRGGLFNFGGSVCNFKISSNIYFVEICLQSPIKPVRGHQKSSRQ